MGPGTWNNNEIEDDILAVFPVLAAAGPCSLGLGLTDLLVSLMPPAALAHASS